MSQPTYRIRVEKDYTIFSAGHFITFDGHQCEPLHGHNYRVAAALEGPLDENRYVYDFTRLKGALRAVVDRLDHRMLLPTESTLIQVGRDGDHVTARYRDKRYLFPESDVVLLPVPNTTAEMLGWWISGEIRAALAGSLPAGLTVLEVEVDESFGQRATCRVDLGGSRGGPA